MGQKIQMAFGALILVGGLSYAAYDYSQAGSLALGDECINDDRCESGTCLQSDTDWFCSEVCTTSCPDGFTCESFEVSSSQTVDYAQSYCVPNPR